MSKLSNLQERTITGLIGVSVFIFGLYYNEYTYFIILFLAINLCLPEFYKMVKSAASPQKGLGFFVSNAILFLCFAYAKGYASVINFALLLPLFSLIFLTELYRNKPNPFSNIGFTILGILYIAIPFSLLNFISFIDEVYHWKTFLGCMLLLWTSDSFAYFSGRIFGRTKLFERISPKKTWEGSVGSLVFSVGMAFLLGIYVPAYSTIDWVVIAVIIVVFGGMGDLVESLLKRSFDIKDSGNMLPGHGGFLDRFDGLLLASPFITSYLILFP